MGQGASYFSEEEQNEILERTNLTPRYLREIQHRYAKLDTSEVKDETGGVFVKDVLHIPEVDGNKLASLLAEKYGGTTGKMYPLEFVNFFSALSIKRLPKEKMDLLFELLDVKKLGYLQGIELYRYYHLMLSPALNNAQIEMVTMNALKAAGGRVTKEKFDDYMPSWQIAEKMTVELQFTT